MNDELERLLASGADIDARDEHGQTALMLAAREGRAQSAAWLVGHGATLDVTAKYGLSALMLAVVNGHVDVVRTLVRAGANLELQGTGAPGFAGKTGDRVYPGGRRAPGRRVRRARRLANRN